ncbi:hypothetical protein Tco_0815681, partial [Tanacetum coccineum]
MTTLKFADTHNMVVFLSKPAESDGFEQIVDFLNAQPIRYALTVNLTIYISFIKQFWSIGVVKTINGEVQLHALVDSKKIIISEASVRRDLKLEDEEDEAIHKELGDSLVRAATTASSLEAEFENVSKLSIDSLLARGDTLRSDEDRLKLNELMELCTTLRKKVLDLEKTKTTQSNEIASLKRRVKKLKKKRSSRTHKLKRLYKVSLSASVESFGDEESLGEDASKQGMINAIDVDEDITLVNVQDDADKEMYDVVTLAQALATLKSLKPKVKGDVIEEPNIPVNVASASTKVSAATTTTTTIPTLRKRIGITELGTPTIMRSLQQPSQAEVHDKGKGKMIEPEPVKKISKKDQLRSDEEEAKRLQAEFDKEERLAREKAKKEKEANIALIEEWDDIQAKIEADHEFAQRLLAEEQEELSVEEKVKLFQQLLEQRKKHFAAKSGEEKRNKPPTQAQQRKIMYQTGWKVVQREHEKSWNKRLLRSRRWMRIKKQQSLNSVWKSFQMKKRIFSQMLKSFNREYLEELYKLVKARYGSTRPVESMDYLLRNDMKIMFEPHVEDEVNMDDPNVTMEEYIRLEEEKAHRSVETEFQAIVFNDKLTSEEALSCEPTVSPLNDNEIEFRISFDESDDKNYMLFDDLDFFKDFENEFPAIVYNDALTSKLDSSTEHVEIPYHVDEFDLKNETSLSECDEEEQNVVYLNDLFSFNIIYPDDLESDKDNDDNKIIIIPYLGDNVINTHNGAYVQ